MDPINPQDGGGQTGGFLDPGLSALIASLLSGGVGFYGYSKTTDADKEEAKKLAIESLGKGIAAESAANAAKVAELEKKQGDEITLRAEIERLKKRNAELERKEAGSSAANALFTSASTRVLQNAVEPTIAGLERKGLVNSDNKAAVTKALGYAAKPQTRLLRMSLPTFFAKQIAPALATTTKGGRRRRRVGGRKEDDLNEYAVLFDKLTNKSGTEKERNRLDELREQLAKFPEGQDEIKRLDAQEQERLDKESGADAASVATESTIIPPPLDSSSSTSSPTDTKTPPSDYDTFVEVYSKALTDAKAGEIKSIHDEVEKASTESQAKSDAKAKEKANAAAVKAAQSILPKVESAIKDGETAIEEQSELVNTLDETRQTKLRENERRALMALIDQAKELVGNPLPESEMKPKKKRFGLFGGFGGDKESILRNVESDEDWKALNEPTKITDLLQKIKDATKTYTEAVKKAQKEETKELTDIGRRSLFRVTVPSSPSNPFAGLIKKLSDPSQSYTEAQVTAIVREETKAKVDFIKNIFKSVDPILVELENLRKKNALPPKKKGGRRKARGGKTPAELAAERSGVAKETAQGRERKSGESAEEQCTKLREQQGYKDGDPKYFYEHIKAIAYGSADIIDETKWVSRKPTSERERSSLKYLLDRLNTGLFSGTADYLKGVRGKELTYTPDDVILAGEAYVLLRCYLKKATEIVKGFIKDDTVVANIQRGLDESAKARETLAKSQKQTMSEKIEWERTLKAHKDTITQLSTELQDLTTAITKEINRRPQRVKDLDVLKLFIETDISNAMGKLRPLENSPEFLSLKSGLDLYDKPLTNTPEGEGETALGKVSEIMKTRNNVYTEKAAPILEEVRKTIETIAKIAQNKDYPTDFAAEIAKIAGLEPAPEDEEFLYQNPIFSKRRMSSIKEQGLKELENEPISRLNRKLGPGKKPISAQTATEQQETESTATSNPNSTPGTPKMEGQTEESQAGNEQANLEQQQEGVKPAELYTPNPLTKKQTRPSIAKQGSKLLKGSSRKSTLKKRRGGKQNGRRTRRGKNRANRSHSHAR